MEKSLPNGKKGKKNTKQNGYLFCILWRHKYKSSFCCKQSNVVIANKHRLKKISPKNNTEGEAFFSAMQVSSIYPGKRPSTSIPPTHIAHRKSLPETSQKSNSIPKNDKSHEMTHSHSWDDVSPVMCPLCLCVCVCSYMYHLCVCC